MSSLMSTYVPFRAFKIQNSDFLFYFETFNFVQSHSKFKGNGLIAIRFLQLLYFLCFSANRWFNTNNRSYDAMFFYLVLPEINTVFNSTIMIFTIILMILRTADVQKNTNWHEMNTV